jgi:hypothetical protein
MIPSLIKHKPKWTVKKSKQLNARIEKQILLKSLRLPGFIIKTRIAFIENCIRNVCVHQEKQIRQETTKK